MFDIIQLHDITLWIETVAALFAGGMKLLVINKRKGDGRTCLRVFTGGACFYLAAVWLSHLVFGVSLSTMSYLTAPGVVALLVMEYYHGRAERVW